MDLLQTVISKKKNNQHEITLTDKHLTNILCNEFNVQISIISEFEINVYLSVLKKFLISWPNWETLDIATNSDSNFEDHLRNAYKNLKIYLSKILIKTEKSIECLQESICKSSIDDNKNEIVLKINCSRQQLNNLFLKKPTPDGNIFQVINSIKEPETFDFKDIINFPMVKTSLFLPGIQIYYKNNSKIERTLMNLKCLNNSIIKNMSHPLKKHSVYYRNETSKHKGKIFKKIVLKYLIKLLTLAVYIKSDVVQHMTQVALHQFIDVISMTPGSIKIGEYRVILHNFKYIRKISVDEVDIPESKSEVEKDIDINNFDLQLQELITPQSDYCIPTLSETKNKFLDFDANDVFHKQFFTLSNWMKVDCLNCDVKFELPGDYNLMMSHFNKQHNSELDWECTGCHNTFEMKQLCKSGWTHVCLPK